MREPRQVPTASIRLAAIQRCEDLIRSGWGRKISISMASHHFGISPASLSRWLSWVADTPLSERPALLSRLVQTDVDETLRAFRTLWGKASADGRPAILNDLAGRRLPRGWSVMEADHG